MQACGVVHTGPCRPCRSIASIALGAAVRAPEKDRGWRAAEVQQTHGWCVPRWGGPCWRDMAGGGVPWGGAPVSPRVLCDVLIGHAKHTPKDHLVAVQAPAAPQQVCCMGGTACGRDGLRAPCLSRRKRIAGGRGAERCSHGLLCCYTACSALHVQAPRGPVAWSRAGESCTSSSNAAAGLLPVCFACSCASQH